jgi:hypothetical protein
MQGSTHTKRDILCGDSSEKGLGGLVHFLVNRLTGKGPAATAFAFAPKYVKDLGKMRGYESHSAMLGLCYDRLHMPRQGMTPASNHSNQAWLLVVCLT